MPAEIILQARKENEVVIEGEVHLVINEDTPSDIVIEVPNQNGRLLSKEMLSNNTLVSSDTIKRPVILVPENNSIGFTGTFVLSPYEPSETYSGVPTGMRIEISATEDFSVIMKNVVINELLTEVPVTFEESSEVLYARVKYVSDSHVSGYSDIVKFTNSDFYVYQPKILTPTMSATGVARTPFIQVSDYQYMGNENYYTGLTYEVATDANFTNIVETDTVGSPNTGGSGSNNGVYLNNFIVDTILDEDTTYYLRVKYLGTLYPESVWSDVISFRTLITNELVTTFSNTLENVIFKHIVDTNGDIVAVGYKRVVGSTNAEMVILKLDNDLNIILSKVFVYGTYDDVIRNISQNTNGDYIITGYIGANPTAKGYVIIMDTNFNIKYNNSLYGDATNDFTGIVKVTDGIIAYGTSYSTPSFGMNDMWVTKFGNNLETPTISKKFGGTGYDALLDGLAIDSNFIGCGHYLTTNVPYELAAIIKLDANLNFVKGFNIGNNTIHGVFIKIINLPTGEMIAVGFTYPQSTGETNARGIIIKVDSNLNLIAQKTFSIGTEGVIITNATIVDNELMLIGNVGVSPINASTGSVSAFIAKVDLDLTSINYIKRLGITNKHLLVKDISFKNNEVVIIGRVKKATTNEADLIIFRLEPNSDIIDTTLSVNGINITTPIGSIANSSYITTNIPNTSTNTSFTAGTIALTTSTVNYTKLTDII